MSPTGHPSQNTLLAFSRGQLTQEQIDRITAHLTHCAECCAVLDAFPNDEFISRLRPRSRSALPAATVRCAAGALCPIGNGAVPPERSMVPGYEIISELGRGGFGVVYKARQAGLGRLVALKVLLAPDGPEDRVRFHREAASQAALHHPNIVEIHDYDTTPSGQPYVVMELVEGGSLASRLADKPLTSDGAATLVRTLALAVECAHRRDIIHRDLKPANILLDTGGAPKIADFGLVKRIECGPELTATGAILGTPSYMAPEQARPDTNPLGPAADIWALGAVFYECLTGRPPFLAANVTDTLLQLVECEPVPPCQLQPKTPRDLETICLKCLRKEPTKRYASAADLAEDLARFQTGEPIRARPVSVWERGRKWVRRKPAQAVVIALLLLLVCGTVGGWWWHEHRIRENEMASALANLEAAEIDQLPMMLDRLRPYHSRSG
jgi:eukaryotic-like serine/threonine-protein kinase